jgi:hypothetical protein
MAEATTVNGEKVATTAGSKVISLFQDNPSALLFIKSGA